MNIEAFNRIIRFLNEDREKSFTSADIRLNTDLDVRAIQRALKDELETSVPRIYSDQKGNTKYYSINDYGIAYVEKLNKIDEERAKKIEEENKRQSMYELEEELIKQNREELISRLEQYLSETIYNSAISEVNEKNSITIDMQKLSEHDIRLYDKACEDPEKFTECLRVAINNVDFVNDYKEETEFTITNLYDSDKIPLAHATRYDQIDKLISFDGRISRVSEVFPKKTVIDYECSGCGTRHSVLCASHEKFPRVQKKCMACNEGILKEVSHKIINVQYIDIQEDKASNPRRVKVIIDKKSMCEDVNPESRILCAGNNINIIGIQKYVDVYENNRIVTTMEVIIKCLGYTVFDTPCNISLSDKDIKEIKKFSKRKDIEEIFTGCIAPHISGNEHIKEAISLQAFGGVKTEKYRGDIHIILVGDASTGKTQMMDSVGKLHPKCIRASGTGSSGIGLTSAIVKDEYTKKNCLEAGALALADKGHINIDEIDKMFPDDAVKMNDALESQKFPINKAGINAIIHSRCSCLANANPRHGSFDRTVSIISQIDISETLLSRFDLKYILIDDKDKERDKRIIDSVFKNQEKDKEYDYEFMKKYIYYAKQIDPKINEDAEKILTDTFMALRDIPSEYRIKVRELMTLMRLTQASARQRLKEVADSEDAMRARDILVKSITMLCGDSIDKCDMRLFYTGTNSENKKSERQHVLDSIPKSGIQIDELISKLEFKELSDPEKIVEDMLREGIIFEIPRGTIRKDKYVI